MRGETVCIMNWDMYTHNIQNRNLCVEDTISIQIASQPNIQASEVYVTVCSGKDTMFLL